MRCLVDAQLPPALARWLTSQGHDAAHVADLGMAQATDTAIWAHALAVDAVIITKDEDFAVRRARDAPGPKIVWLRLPNLRRQDIIGRFEAVLPTVVTALDGGETLIEIV